MIPKRSLFTFRLPIAKLKPPKSLAGVDDHFQARHSLPPIEAMDDRPRFGAFYVGWHSRGVLVGVEVWDWHGRFLRDAKRYWNADGLRVFIDTRDTRDAARASRFCQQFYLLPVGSEDDEPIAGRAKIQRAREEPPDIDESLIEHRVEVGPSQWSAVMHLPADVLYGYDPAQFPRIGLCLSLHDHQLGTQALTAGGESEYWANPSTWASCELVDA